MKQFTRGAGILLSITSLPSPYGIGTLGAEAYRFVDLLVELYDISVISKWYCPAYWEDFGS